MATTAESYVIREVKKDDESDLVKLLEEHFFLHEYLTMVYCEKNKHKIHDIERKNMALDVKTGYTVKVANNPCLIAVHNDSKEIVGISLLIVEENPKFTIVPESENKKSSARKSTVKRSKLLAELHTYIFRPILDSFDVFAQFPSHRKALDLFIICVNPKHSSHGLATRLIKESIRYAENNGCGLIYGIFTSPASQKAAEKNGFEKFNNIDIWRLRDGDGVRIYQDEEFHIISTMGKVIHIATGFDI